ncbi:hypothetical protein ACFWSF_14085 [Streptomyces sp. NPDC058611]|uniref:hypothetical protein n=1 Tax=unclassified Streptomyces TaxID=2593676 RepID=UPI003664D3A4
MSALVYDRDFREKAARRLAWGFGLLAAASGVWLWVAAQLLLPFAGPSDQDCESRVFYDAGDGRQPETYAEAEGGSCEAERDLGGLLALTLLSLPFAVVGTVLYTSSSTATRLSAHAAELARLEDSTKNWPRP